MAGNSQLSGTKLYLILVRSGEMSTNGEQARGANVTVVYGVRLLVNQITCSTSIISPARQSSVVAARRRYLACTTEAVGALVLPRSQSFVPLKLGLSRQKLGLEGASPDTISVRFWPVTSTC